jgi:hypothetical protein
VPKKIRELKAILLRANFTYRSGEGSHTVWSHPLLPYMPLSGKDGADADRYQERDIKNALRDLNRLNEDNGERE